jgi:phosphoglycolate phosphatase
MPRTSPARLIAFDLDGTLVDSSRDLATAVNRALPRVLPGTPPLDVELVRGFIGEGATLLIRRCLDHLGRTDVESAPVLEAFLEAYRGCLLDTTRLYPGVEEALAQLAAWAEPPVLAVLTNKPGDLSRALLDGLHVRSRFARVLGSGDGVPRKPDPAGLVALMAEFGAGPHATALVGDSRIDVLTGRAAGVVTVGVDYGLDPVGLRAAGPDMVLADMRALPAYLEREFMLG